MLTNRPIGIYNLVGWGLSQREMFEKYKQHGFTHVGLYWHLENEDEIAEMVKNARDFGLEIEIVHGPLRDNAEIWKEGEVAESYFEYIKMCLANCKKFGITKFVMHSAGKEAFKFNELGLSRFAKLVGLAKEYGITFFIENLRTVDHSIYLLEKIQEDNFKFCLDTGHANIWCYSPMELVEKYKDRVQTVHFNDNDGIEFHDYHYIPFEGTVDWNKLMPMLNKYYTGPIMLELNNFKDPNKSYTDLDEYLTNAYNAGVKLSKI